MQFSIFKSQISNKGQSLFELVVAIGISALIIVVLVSLVSNGLQNAAFAKNESLAGRYAEQTTEWLRSERDKDTSTFVTEVEASLGTKKCFNDLNWSSTGSCDVVGGTIDDSSGGSTIFTRDITFSSVSADPTKTIIEAVVDVSWTDSKGSHTVTSATDFSDWRQR